jgi:predicted branched-subunit amino acid permease
LFFRGYCQTRLEEDFGGIGAIVVVALFTALGHNQYHHLNLLSIGSIVSAILCFLGIGWVYWCSRSLIPGMIIHGAMNLPTKGRYDFVLPAVMILVLILFWKDWQDMIRGFWEQASNKGWKVAAFGGTAVAVAMVVGFETQPGVFIPVAFLGLAAALLIEFSERRRMIATDEKSV